MPSSTGLVSIAIGVAMWTVILFGLDDPPDPYSEAFNVVLMAIATGMIALGVAFYV